MSNGFASPTASVANGDIQGAAISVIFSGTFGATVDATSNAGYNDGVQGVLVQSDIDRINSILRYDPSLVSGSTSVAIASISRDTLTGSNGTAFNFDDLVTVTLTGGDLDDGTSATSDRDWETSDGS